MPKIEIRVASGNQAGTVIPVPEGRFIIGREHDCHLRPNSELISRHHCAFTCDSEGVRLRDLGSTNGTFLNGNRVQGTIGLKAGDRVTAGKVELVVVIDGEPQLSAEETVMAEKGDTAFLNQNYEPTAKASDSWIDIGDMADELAGLEDETFADPEAAIESADTAAAVPQAQASPADTQQFAAFDPAAAAAQQQQFAPNPWGNAPQFAYPQYPPMPYGYGYPYPGPQQGMPPGYGYPPPQQQPVEPASEPPATGKASGMPEIRLPDPSETGAKAPEPKAPAGGGKSGAHIPTAAQDIINTYLNRRPKTE